MEQLLDIVKHGVVAVVLVLFWRWVDRWTGRLGDEDEEETR